MKNTDIFNMKITEEQRAIFAKQRRTKSILTKVYCAAMLIASSVAAYAWYQAYCDCSDLNGTLVRGMFWFDCVEGK